MSLSLEKLRSGGYLSSTGLALVEMNLTRQDYEDLGVILGELHKTIQFAIGDYLREGERRYGEEAYQLQEALGISPDSKQQYIRVAERIEMERRRPELTWSHHRSVASLEPAQQDEWLDRAIANGWSRGELDEHMREPKEGAKIVVEELIRSANVVIDEAKLYEVTGEYVLPGEPIDDLRRALAR